MPAPLVDMEMEKIGVVNLNRASGDGIDPVVGVDENHSCSTLVRNEKVKDGDEKGHGNDEELENGGFRVGDFVWAKIKSYPWCPGQVYDPRDAPEFALKHSVEGCLLVAFFGDGSCAWCLPSQLIHFVENFKEMSAGGTSWGFIKAVQGAVDEVSSLVESKMTCKCIPVGIRDGMARAVEPNAAIKEGILAPEADMDNLSLPDYKPDQILSELVHFARGVLVDNNLEFAVLRSWLSAFYCAKGGYRLPMCCESLHIEGMEDKNENLNDVSNDFSFPIEVPILGSENDNTMMSQLLSGDKFYCKRKQKSVAKLMEGSAKVKPKSKKRAAVKGGEIVKKSVSSRRKSNDDVDEDSSTEFSDTAEVNTKKVLNGGIRDVNGASEKTTADAENTCGKLQEELEKLSMPRERKKSKYLNPPYTIPTWWVRNASYKTYREYDNRCKKSSGGTRVTSFDDEAYEEMLPDDDLEGFHAPVNVNPTTIKVAKKMTFDESDVDVPVDKLILELESAAVDALYLSKEGTLDIVWAFASAFRSFTYFHGLDYKLLRKCKTGRKRKFPSLLQNQEDSLDQGHAKSGSRTPKAVKTERKQDSSRSEEADEASITRNDLEKIDGNALSCLVLTFSPEFSLPSKEEIVRLFCKFGFLNEKETKVVMDSHSAQIVYMKDSDAEAAFKSSVDQKPFGIENVVNYSLQYSLACNHPKTSCPCKESPEKPGSSQSTADVFLSATASEKVQFLANSS